MFKTLMNLTEHSILQEIERILELYPDYPYQQAFTHPDLRQTLLAWVLNRVPNIFIMIENAEEMIVHPDYAPYCRDQQSCVELVIREGIQEILRQNQAAIAHYLLAEEIPEQAASQWFG